ncbi:dCMP deaminase [Mesorhizobium sp. WSM4307]|uniref:anti-phage dCTP deaminase n=1 Tax=unclassified Mesorhizobium TaxID=325217 RepID=UPI00115D9390|nr:MULTISPECIES: anti-phage dCTP deaminase [unclassified Mesorhizobium]TRC75623.1 dCMP deaminase [Mesorhizobium sp. WSM4315]TRC86366.1 dCMP deaminase [Mesorhizobium sp. WSM4307]
MSHLIPRIEFPEIVIGLVAPIGTPLGPTVSELQSHFEAVGYQVRQIKVTDIYRLLSQFILPKDELTENTKVSRYKSYIAYGNQVRKEMDDNSILAALTIYRIVGSRIKNAQIESERFSKVVYILDQFKRQEEIELLRAVYGRVFFQVSVYSRRSARVDYLARSFAVDAGELNHDHFRSAAEELVNEDQNQQKEKYGQRVAKIFHDADFIVNKDISDPDISSQIKRFFELLFSANFHTPSKMEYGMFAAKSAALRTADLSRQVGAAIFSGRGEVIALGSNEVPKAGGGTYWPDEQNDDREFKRGNDSNDARKREILNEILKILERDASQLDKETKRRLDDAALMDALEYGRIVHAEMSALLDAARIGRSVKDSVLFTTTFPCHMCAKHIVASGVSEVVFLEPYPKSLASRLHADSIEIEGQERGGYKDYPSVEFKHFFGVTPRRYREFFERNRRKDRNGDFERYASGQKRPFFDIKSPFYTQLEETVLQSIRSAIERFGAVIEG